MLNLEGTNFTVSFLASILYYLAMMTGGGDSALSTVLLCVVFVIVGFGYTCYSAAMLPFITDQIIGATSDELSAVVRWYYWVLMLVYQLSNIDITQFVLENLHVISTVTLAFCNDLPATNPGSCAINS